MESIVNKGNHTSQKFRNAYDLLNCDEGEYSEIAIKSEISKILKVGMRTIDRINKRFVEEGFDVVLERKPKSRKCERKADGDFETRLVALSSSDPPEGFSRWSFRLMADKMVELETLIPFRTKRFVPF